MICLAIICLLNLLVKGEDMDGRMSLTKLNLSLYEAGQYMDNQLMNEDSAIFFGNSRSGRSTLINYLMGNKLKLKQYSKFSPKAIIKADNESLGPEIGIGSLSTTIAPKGWTSRIFPNLTLWDVPGFRDNRGPVQDCTNSFYLYRLVKSVKSLKIVLLVDLHDIIQDNVEQFLSLLESIKDLFGNQFKHSFKSISVIFTKVPEYTMNRQLIDKEYIKYHLDTRVILDGGLKLSEVTKNFTTFLLQNDNRFALFKGISFISNATADIDADIISVLNNSKRIPNNLLQNVRPMISATSMVQLLKAKEIIELGEMIKSLGNVLVDELRVEKENIKILKKMSNKTKLNNIKYKLIKMRQNLSSLLTNESNFNKNIKTIFSMAPNRESIFDMQKLMINLQLIQSVESVLHITISKALKITVDFLIYELILHCKSTISYVEVALGNISPEDHKNIRTKNENETNRELENLRNKVHSMSTSDVSFFEGIINWFKKIFHKIF